MDNLKGKWTGRISAYIYLVKNKGRPIVHCFVIFLAFPILEALPTLT
jgi:hypothetical protein